ncbi:hypothetical protein Srubr_19870 [Streptomyces rubradiris]|uniref:FXSXX-COOH protein n=1 Tax=Streptomyces rubradiris TaxID=285531 RepID=A0ABQ3R8H8_STRRR|nr:hypothetical protein [Streptomyces rubradiris]GHH23181.1 hypothetical protein GCM10018792_59610 [Streptomyces rubradiris]GHI52141.1 hypothetical protein Srubr_19870 [Streptomyces rubradiris]
MSEQHLRPLAVHLAQTGPVPLARTTPARLPRALKLASAAPPVIEFSASAACSSAMFSANRARYDSEATAR